MGAAWPAIQTQLNQVTPVLPEGNSVQRCLIYLYRIDALVLGHDSHLPSCIYSEQLPVFLYIYS